MPAWLAAFGLVTYLYRIGLRALVRRARIAT
jgi:hypothetical protein